MAQLRPQLPVLRPRAVEGLCGLAFGLSHPHLDTIAQHISTNGHQPSHCSYDMTQDFLFSIFRWSVRSVIPCQGMGHDTRCPVIIEAGMLCDCIHQAMCTLAEETCPSLMQ